MHPLAHHHRPGAAPTILFLPGYASDMSGTKALALDAWAQASGRALLRFDYRGCGASPGAFEDFTLADWRDDVLRAIDAVSGPVLLVGSSMGGWLMLLAALARPARIAGLVGIAAAPDFTDWGFTPEEKRTLLSQGRLERATPYGPAPMRYTRAFWQAGEALRVMHGSIAVTAPVRLLHGMADAEVPYQRAVALAEQLRSADVQLLLVKEGDHRLSRADDLARLIRAIEELL